jgi:hypothetical protein
MKPRLLFLSELRNQVKRHQLRNVKLVGCVSIETDKFTDRNASKVEVI